MFATQNIELPEDTMADDEMLAQKSLYWESSFWSKLFFTYGFPLKTKAFTKGLRFQDFGGLPTEQHI